MKAKFLATGRPHGGPAAPRPVAARRRNVVLTSTEARIEGCRITAYKGTVQGETWNELLRRAQEIGANAVLNTCFDDALDVDTLFHGAAVVIEPLP